MIMHVLIKITSIWFVEFINQMIIELNTCSRIM